MERSEDEESVAEQSGTSERKSRPWEVRRDRPAWRDEEEVVKAE